MKYNFIRYIPSVVWMGIIFYLSHQPASESAETSRGLVDFALNIVPVPTDYEIIIHTIIRKLAHFIAYTILGILIYFAYRGKQAVLFTLIVCLLFAISDEIHQLFIPGRSGEIRDVLIDVSGAVFGLIIVKLFIKLISRRGVDV